MKITYEIFKQIKQCQMIGMTQIAAANQIGISQSTVRRWWKIDKDGYMALSEQNEYELDNYREYIVSLLKVCPQIRETNILYKLKEQFPEFEVKRSTFYRYMEKLRYQTGFVVDRSRKTTVRENTAPGYEAQVDFGQYKLKDMYGRNLRIYFFCMVLSYSRMRFAYFSAEPFTTETAIKAHNFAFKYFGGRTQTIMYDQDRVFVVSENLGNIIFVKEFETYVKEVGYSVILCRPRDPQTKGKVENLVKVIKESFLLGREYAGIDSLNSDCLAWLDREGNNIPHAVTHKAPRELFAEEVKYLKKVRISIHQESSVFSVNSYNCVSFGGNQYELPLSTIVQCGQVRVKQDGEMLLMYDAANNVLLCKHTRSDENGQIIKLSVDGGKNDLPLEKLKKKFFDSNNAVIFLEKLEQTSDRYLFSQVSRLTRLSNHYKKQQIMEAMDYCLEKNKISVFELASFLIYRYGETIARQSMPYVDYNNCMKRAREIREELYG